MITKLNLATRPFRNRTTPYLLSLLLLGVSVAAGLFCFAQLRDAAAENEKARRDIERLKEDIAGLEAIGDKVKQQLTPDQQMLLVASHRLVANKSFGWSRLFADLEAVLPGNVSASRIAVENVYKDGDRIKAELDFAVLSRDYQGVSTMIGNMQNSGLFQVELRGQDRQQTDRSTYTEYSLHLVYTPAYGYAASTEIAQQSGGDQ